MCGWERNSASFSSPLQNYWGGRWPTLQMQELILLSGFAGVHQALPGFGILQFLQIAAFVSKWPNIYAFLSTCRHVS